MKTADERRAIKNAMPRIHLHSVHTRNCRLLPDRYHLLDAMPKAATVAEIGVAFGDYSQEILERCAPKKLFLVDAWASDRYSDGLSAIQNKFASQIERSIVEVRQGLSTEVLKKFAPNSIDWAYIDTNHSYQTTIEELRLCASCLVSDGRIAGHDFCTGNVVSAIPYGVVESVMQFCLEDSWEFEYLTLDPSAHFSFCIKPISEN
ncbi:class I SAM-dependent methyltransferase [Rhodophyticola porphyridii]|uniref:Class I SAM-dependent methyltransferase n=1 Tax=Rhodophyticola porphyridii TaxID=1852017 RepID=A0A3L9Y4S5_9RHOB|nr:class I SAM-dependent methyltransferase [Rhodophyticola porphyridii]RMA42338.1 class I SAM-dependent methyltransferase [Rhodophyticola porphyridii]